MSTSFIVFIAGAVLVAAAAFWMLRAWRKADATARPVPALIVAALVAVTTLGVYIALGRPDLPDGAYAARMAALQARAQRENANLTIDEVLALLEARAKAEPHSAEPLIYRGQVLLDAGDAQGAARAFDAALRRFPLSIEARMGLGRSLVVLDEGRVSPQALEIFREVADRRAGDPAPRIYLAMAAMQANQPAEARRLWGEAYERMDPNDPRREMARQMSRGQVPSQRR